MVNVLYIGETVIITQDATQGIINYLDKDITRKWSLEWNELLDCYADAISEDNGNGTYYDKNFEELMKERYDI